MPQSLADVVLHLVFSTKDRFAFLRTESSRNTMTAYLIGALQNLDCPPLQVGVVQDHVHILCNFSRTMTIARLIEQLKTSSSARIKEEGGGLKEFYWQNGYGAFSVSESNVSRVREYVLNQEEHHRTRTFQEEFRLLLKKHRLEWDERYVWE